MRIATVVSVATLGWVYAASAAEPAEPWPKLPVPYAKKLTAARQLSAGAFALYHEDRSVVHVPSAVTVTSEEVQWPLPVDAAVAWNDEMTLLFVGDRTLLVGAKDGSVVDRELSELNLPKGWNRVDAAARYGADHWILFRAGKALLYQIPTDKNPGGPVWGIKLSDWWTDWGSGIDAAMSLSDGRLVVFRDNQYRLVDILSQSVTTPTPYTRR